MSRDIPNSVEITMYLHCGLCVSEIPEDQSPAEWADLAVGWTKLGLQVWCNRHDCNVLHVDFESMKHPANTTRRMDG